MFNLISENQSGFSPGDFLHKLITVSYSWYLYGFRSKRSFRRHQNCLEVVFTRLSYSIFHTSLTFSNSPVQQTSTQKHLGLISDYEIYFWKRFKAICYKINKSKGTLRKLHNKLCQTLLSTIYKSFIRPYVDFGDVIHCQLFDCYFHQKLESIRCNAALVLTGAIRRTPRGNFIKN